MDPLGNQPAQPNPQPPIQPIPTPLPPTSPAPVAPPVEAAPVRPEPVTPPTTPSPERPVQAWPPTGTPAAQEASKIAAAPQTPSPAVNPTPEAISQTEAQTMGTEVAEAAGAIPVGPGVTPISSPNPPSQPSPLTGMDGFVSPAAKEIKDSVGASTEVPMSDQQADKLFQEEPATKARKKHAKLKKVFISLVVLVILAGLAGGGYIFFFGNKAAQSYVSTSSATTYKEAFTQIQGALSEQPVNTAELEAGFNKLKVASDNTKELSPVILGTLNTNYKDAEELSKLEAGYKTKAKVYQEKYAAYTEYLGALSDSFLVISKVEDLNSTDLTTLTVEQLGTLLNGLVKDGNAAVKRLEASTKPESLSDDSKTLQDNLTALIAAISAGPVTSTETGVLSTADQAIQKTHLDLLSKQATDLSKGVTITSLVTYQQSALDDAKALQQEAQELTS